MSCDRRQVKRRVPVDDHIERLRHRLKPFAADPEIEVLRNRVRGGHPRHLGIQVDAQAVTERPRQSGQRLASAGADIQHVIRWPQVPRDQVLVVPRHGLTKHLHAGEVPASPRRYVSEKLIESLLRVRLPHERPT
jgi:hypothetical protein